MHRDQYRQCDKLIRVRAVTAANCTAIVSIFLASGGASFAQATRESEMPRERRKTFRVEWNSPATIYDLAERFPRPCVVSNFSTGGARITGVRPETIAEEFLLRLGPRCRVRKCRVMWRTHDALGVEFCDAVMPAPVTEVPQRKRELAQA